MDLEASVTVEDGRLMRQVASMYEYFGEGHLRVFIIEGRPSQRLWRSAKAAEALASMGLPRSTRLLPTPCGSDGLSHLPRRRRALSSRRPHTGGSSSQGRGGGKGWRAAGPIVANVRELLLPSAAPTTQKPLRTANQGEGGGANRQAVAEAEASATRQDAGARQDRDVAGRGDAAQRASRRSSIRCSGDRGCGRGSGS